VTPSKEDKAGKRKAKDAHSRGKANVLIESDSDTDVPDVTPSKEDKAGKRKAKDAHYKVKANVLIESDSDTDGAEVTPSKEDNATKEKTKGTGSKDKKVEASEFDSDTDVVDVTPEKHELSSCASKRKFKKISSKSNKNEVADSDSDLPSAVQRKKAISFADRGSNRNIEEAVSKTNDSECSSTNSDADIMEIKFKEFRSGKAACSKDGGSRMSLVQKFARQGATGRWARKGGPGSFDDSLSNVDEPLSVSKGKMSLGKVSANKKLAETSSSDDEPLLGVKGRKSPRKDSKIKRSLGQKSLAKDADEGVAISSSDEEPLSVLIRRKSHRKNVRGRPRGGMTRDSCSDSEVVDVQVTPRKDDNARKRKSTMTHFKDKKDDFSESDSDTDVVCIVPRKEKTLKVGKLPKKALGSLPKKSATRRTYSESSDSGDETFSSIKLKKSQTRQNKDPMKLSSGKAVADKSYFDKSSDSESLPDLISVQERKKREQNSPPKGDNKTVCPSSSSLEEPLSCSPVLWKRKSPKKVCPATAHLSSKSKRKAVSSSESDDEPLTVVKVKFFISCLKLEFTVLFILISININTYMYAINRYLHCVIGHLLNGKKNTLLFMDLSKIFFTIVEQRQQTLTDKVLS
jgi:hypothetical protein